MVGSNEISGSRLPDGPEMMERDLKLANRLGFGNLIVNPGRNYLEEEEGL
jgi:hypothetical protein